jgi:crotonobetainyl-CoA:carnitine CoA-transferase CaiB-like acyl-CoA transferase
MATALNGIRVVDLTDESGVFATRLLADLGADVVRIEPPDGGRVRRLRPYLSGATDFEKSFYHQFHNANKRSVVLDLSSEAGQASLDKLLEFADVLVQSGPLAEIDRLVIDPDRLGRRFPNLIHVSITPFGRNGPWSGWRGFDLIAAASGGLLYPSGGPEDPPMHGNADPSFKMAGLQAAVGTLLALHARARSGSGHSVDISLQEATVMAMVQQLNPNLYSRERQIPRRAGLYGPLFRCADGRWVAIRVRPDRFKRFLDWAASEGVKSELEESSLPELQQGGRDINARDEVTRVLQGVVSKLTLDQALNIAWALDLIALPVGHFAEMASRDHLVATGQFRSVVNPALGCSLSFTRSPLDGMGDGVSIRPAPVLGAHTAEVLKEWEGGKRSARAVYGFDAAMPLRGVRVVDFTWVLAGPFGTRLLANFGAEVIRIESHARPDSSRTGTPSGATSLDVGYLFNDANAGKKSLTVDVSQPEGRELVLRLVAKADVVTNNFRPGALERMGFGFDVLRKVNPNLILVSLPGCGSKGPWADRGTLGGVLMAASGLNDISGFEGRPPYGIATAFPDFTSPYLLAISVLAALHERQNTGRGQEVEVNQLSATIGLLGVEWMRFAAEGGLPRNQNRNPNLSPHGVYPCIGEDSWVAIAVDGDEQWQALARLIGTAAEDLRFGGHADRKRHEDRLDEVIRSWTTAQDKWEVAARLQQIGVAAAPVESLADLIDLDPQLKHRNHYQRIHQPSEPQFDLTIDGEAIKIDSIGRILLRAPMMGEHNEYVIRELIGLTESEFDALVVRQVVN